MRILLVGLLLTAVPGRARAEERPWGLGLQLAADTPAGAAAALTLRPGAPWARLHAGVTWNYFAFGVQGGATFLPVRAAVSPTATVEIGTSFDADLRSPLSGLHLPPAAQPSLASAGYTYLSGLLGLELGGETTALFLRGGLARAWSTLRGVSGYPAGAGTIDSTPLHVAAWVPAVQAGIVVRLW